MIIRLSIFVCLLTLVACSSNKKITKTEANTTTTSTTVITYQPNEDITMDRFLQDAILTGLQRDQITTELATKIANISKYFVAKCNICKNVNKALKAHKGYTDASKMTGQAETALTIVKEAANHSETGKDAFKKMINSYVQYHFRYSKLTSTQKAQIEQMISIEAKKGKALMSMYSFCPSCDGAEGACKKE